MSAILSAVHEKKNLDLQVIGQAISGTAYYYNLLNGCAQGTAAPNRQGRKTKMESLRLSMIFALSPLAIVDTVRIMVVLDKECRGTSAGSSDILTTNTFGQAAILSSWNFDNVPTRFKILYDEALTIHSDVVTNSTTTDWSGTLVHRLIHIPMKTEVHYYDVANGGIGGIDANSLALFVFGGQATNTTTLFYDSRVVFRDL
jgi:hypothetical protein